MLPDESARPHPEAASGLSRCYRHPEQETGISCTRCGRPICPQCMVSASVGFHCPECVQGTRQQAQRTAARTRFGGPAGQQGALVTRSLIGINLAVFLLTQYLSPQLKETLSLHSLVPPYWYEPYGVAAGPGQWYRLVTAAFVHTGVLHVGMNMVSLWVLGPGLEQVLGRLRFVGLYAVSGLAGNAFAYLVSGGDLYSVGASGAIFGLLGATAVLFRVSRTPLGPLMAMLVFNLVITFSVPYIDWRAHVGGLVAGAVTGVGLMYAPRAHRNLVQGLTVAGMLAVVVVLVLVGTARLGV
ncbi:rhomboid family intramembrane serine protease [Kitasatospora sp. GP82]|uniref:rhomboid family intramembrane serine protease n=1 Tax=Kitasatospora sp. GP82 TaxID=3035089 RepID=UPI0024738466|nr:rhomboid family intramembrane serine protease [Kitasatospora sp. GP82]MDH6127635.1 membrane associated rhomboid family serine protease [Kitasatospora sp. GP82]